MGLSAYERETVILTNDEEKTAQVTSCQKGVWTRMEKLGIKPDREETLDGEVVTKFFTVPKSWIKINPPKQVEMTEEQRKKKSDLMKALRQKQLEVSR